jgi:N6-adenosine-specific RNA methylase IME4
MVGRIEPGPTLMPGEPRYERLREAFATMKLDPLQDGAPIHSLANLLPMLPEIQRPAFRQSLAEQGQNHAVIFHRGVLLDGRNRARELIELGRPISTGLFTGTDSDALDLVTAENIDRRHLNESQRADFAARVAELRIGANQHTRKAAQNCAPSLFAGNPPVVAAGGTDGEAAGPDVRPDASPPQPEAPPQPLLSQSEAAEKFNVSRRLVQMATVYQQKGIPELSEKVQAGELAASVAAEIAALPIEQQREIIAQADPKAVKEVAKKNRAERAKAGHQRRIDNMRKADATPLLDGGEKAGVFYVDIPREFVSWSEETGEEKSPKNHYRIEKFQFLADMRDQILARAKPNAVMFMWAWANSLQDQLDLMTEWGFASIRRRDEAGRLLRDERGEVLPPVGDGRYRSHQVWVKRASTGNLHRGTGYWFIDSHELLLVGARGDVPAPLMGTQAMSVIEAVIGAHSEKPNEIFRDQLDHYFPGVRKLELFGRTDDLAAFHKRWPDWEIIGNDVVAAQQGAIDNATGAAPAPSPARDTDEEQAA